MRNKKRLLANAGGVIACLMVLGYITNRPGHIPPYDANLVRLVETERQGYCSGLTFWKTSGEGNAGQASQCRSEYREKSGEVNLPVAIRGFCEAIVESGWEGYVTLCAQLIADQQLWPTYDGSITDQWNRARPYPYSPLGGSPGSTDGSRTGDRGAGMDHGGPSRVDNYYPGG